MKLSLTEIIGKKTDPIIFVGILLLVSAIISAMILLYRKQIREQFSSQFGSELSDSIGDGVSSSWVIPDKNKTLNAYSRMETNVTRSSPLPESEMLIFNNNKFTPECCPSTYSNSSGCLCATPEQIKYLNTHGGNRTPGGAPTEY